MARIKIRDLQVNQKVDPKVLKQGRGGYAVLYHCVANHWSFDTAYSDIRISQALNSASDFGNILSEK